MFFSENACCYCQPLSSTLPVTLLFVHPLKEMLKCCFCGSEGASMTDFHYLQLKEQLLLQQKWEDDVWPPVTTNGNNATLGRKQKAQVAEKVLSIIRKYKRTQLPFFDELRVFDPRQRDSMPSNIDAYSHLLCRPVATFLSDLFLHGKKKDSFECRSEPSDKKCKKTSVGGRAK